MLLDPFEKDLNLPTFPVEFRDCKGIKCCIIGNEPVNYIGSIVLIYNHPEWLGIMLSRLVAGKTDHLIADYPGLQISGAGAFNSILHIVFCPGNEESSFSMDEIEQTEEVQVSLIYHVDGSRFYIKVIEDLNIMDRSFGQSNKDRKFLSF